MGAMLFEPLIVHDHQRVLAVNRVPVRVFVLLKESRVDVRCGAVLKSERRGSPLRSAVFLL